MTEKLKELFDLSHFVGSKIPLWNQGFGGNISYKQEDLLYVKATGKKLDKINLKQDIAAFNWKFFYDSKLGISEEEYKNSLSKYSIQNSDYGIPSMETGLHSISKDTWVIHFHSLAMILFYEMSHTNYLKEYKDIFLNFGLNMAFISKVLPGLSLCQEILKCPHQSNLIIIQNHGVVLRSNKTDIIYDFVNAENKIIELFGWDLNVAPISISPLKAYLPDTAVYWKEFIRYLIPMEKNLYKLEDTAPFYLKEIWQAQDILFKNYPPMQGYSDQEIAQINSLPTELIRTTKKIGN